MSGEMAIVFVIIGVVAVVGRLILSSKAVHFKKKLKNKLMTLCDCAISVVVLIIAAALFGAL